MELNHNLKVSRYFAGASAVVGGSTLTCIGALVLSSQVASVACLVAGPALLSIGIAALMYIDGLDERRNSPNSYERNLASQIGLKLNLCLIPLSGILMVCLSACISASVPLYFWGILLLAMFLSMALVFPINSIYQQ